MSIDLAGRYALVTGASRGIGHGLAKALADAGATVMATARDLRSLNGLVAETRGARGVVVPFAGDLSQGVSIRECAAQIAADFGRLDILIANAAMMGARCKLADISEDEWAQIFATNVTAAWRLVKYVGPPMQKSASPRAIFLTSGSGSKLAPGRGAYAISKAALDAVVRTWAAEAEGTPMRVMLVNPGPMRTDMRASIMPNEDPLSLKTPADLAPKILPMCAESWTQNGVFYDFPRDAILEFRGPA